MSGHPFDLVVVGAGIIGTWVTYVAHRTYPQWRILLVDRSLVANGVTRYASGLNLPYGRCEQQKALSSKSLELYADLQTRLPALPIADAPLAGIAPEDEAPEIIERFTRRGAHVASSTEIAAVRETYPDLRVPEGHVLLTGCDASYGDPAAVVQGMVGWLRENGTEVWEGVEINRVEMAADSHVLTTACGRRIRAEHTVLAAGPWMLNGLGAETLRASDARIKKIVAFRLNRRPPRGAPVVFFFAPDAYLLPNDLQGNWLLSISSREWDCTPEISRLSISSDDRRIARDVLADYCPSLADRCEGGRVFCDAFTGSRVPLVAPMPGLKRASVAGACCGFGFRLAPAIAQSALQMAATC